MQYKQKYGELCKKYFEIFISQSTGDTMNKIAKYYYKLGEYDTMINCYVSAIRKGNKYSLINLGLYYEQQQKYDLMEEYFILAI